MSINDALMALIIELAHLQPLCIGDEVPHGTCLKDFGHQIDSQISARFLPCVRYCPVVALCQKGVYLLAFL